MITVSDDYKAQIIKPVRRFTVKGSIDYSDYNIDNSITTTINKPDRLSLGDQMADGIEEPVYKFWSWGNFEWGQHLRDPESELEQGGLSFNLCDINNNFSVYMPQGFGDPNGGFGVTGFIVYQNYPSFRINFVERTVTSLKAVFDSKLNEYAVDFDVNIYTDDYDVPDHTENITGNTSYRWTKDITAVLLSTAIEIVVKKWSHNLSKAKVIEIFTSLQLKYDASNIKSITVIEETESDSCNSPVGNVVSNSININLFNLNNKFDNDNLLSVLYGNVIKNRRLKFSTWLNNLIDDDIPLGTFYADQWKINNEKMSAEVSGKDVLFLMSESEYKNDQFITPGVDQNFVYDEDAEFATFTLDNVLSDEDSLIFQGGAVQCFETYEAQSGFGQAGFGSVFGFSGPIYCGTLQKEITYNYVPGTSITLTLAIIKQATTGSEILWYINYKTVEDWILFTDTITFTPENISILSQTFSIRGLMITGNLDDNFRITEIDITLNEKVTLYSLATKIIQDYDDETNLIEGKYIIDQEYANYEIPHAFFTPQSYRSVLKKIVEAAGGRAYQRRDGYIILEALQQIGTTVKEYTDSNIFELTQPVKPYTLYNRVTVLIYEYIIAAAAEDVANIPISILDTEVQTMTIRFEKFPVDATTVAYSGLPASVTITDETIYTWGVDIEITNASGADEDFELTIEAKVYELLGNRSYTLDDTTSIRKNGIIELPIDNYLIQSISQAQSICLSIINSFKVQRRIFQSSVVYDPALMLDDTVTINGTKYLVNKSKIEYNINNIVHTIEGRR